MEMTGLDPETCVVLEVAAVVTDVELRPLEEFSAIVRQPPEELAKMDEWNTRTHGGSGLAAAVASGRPLADVEADLVAFVGRHFGEEPAVLCGNSIGQDRRFVERYMPDLAARLHYRVVDVSSFKEVLRRRYGLTYKKRQAHRAIDDIRESLAELAFYLEGFSPPG